MQTVTIDTHEAIEALRAKKFTKEQAKGIVDTICSVELYGVATAEDMRRLEKEITELSHRVQQLETRLIIKLSGVMLIMMSFFKAMEHFF